MLPVVMRAFERTVNVNCSILDSSCNLNCRVDEGLKKKKRKKKRNKRRRKKRKK